VRVLRGEIADRGAWEGEAPDYADALTIARLHVLERQGRFQEYLYLAEAEGQTERYMTMLVRLGRVTASVTPEHPSGSTLPHAAAPVQHQPKARSTAPGDRSWSASRPAREPPGGGRSLRPA
jgi:hypothetical protein